MKRERRILAITGDREIVVSVLYRGKLWFEGVDVKILGHKVSIEDVLRSKYLEQARIIIIDEELLKNYPGDVEKALTKLKPVGIKTDVVVVKKEGDSSQEFKEEGRKVNSQDYVPEALRVARKIFYEVRSVIQKVS